MCNNKKQEVVYIVMASEEFDEGSYVADVFSEKKHAQKYIDIQNELDDSYAYYMTECVIKSDYNMNASVRGYYSYYVSKEDDFDFNQGIEFDYYEIKQWLIENKYLDKNKLEQIEENDDTLNSAGNKAHIKCGEFIKANIDDNIMKELINFINSPEVKWYNDPEPEKRIYDKDLVLEETDEYIQVYSVDSFEIARSEALRLYENWKTNRSNSI